MRLLGWLRGRPGTAGSWTPSWMASDLSDLSRDGLFFAAVGAAAGAAEAFEVARPIAQSMDWVPEKAHLG